MEIVDSQIHFGPGRIEETLAAMDTIGISAVLADEFWGLDNWGPGYTLDNGVLRVTTPTVELATNRYPDRFSYVKRVDRRDPEAESLIRMIKNAPGARALRILPALTALELEAFGGEGYDEMLSLAEELRLPVFAYIAGHVELIPRHLEKFPGLQFIVDHCGMPIEQGISFLDEETPNGDGEHAGPNITYFSEVLKLGAYPNVALKWSHAQGMFGELDYPSAGIIPYLRRAIDAFGVERIMWASDQGGDQTGETWGNLVYYLRDCTDVTDSEKEWLMGRTVRTLLDWPAPNITNP